MPVCPRMLSDRTRPAMRHATPPGRWKLSCRRRPAVADKRSYAGFLFLSAALGHYLVCEAPAKEFLSIPHVMFARSDRLPFDQLLNCSRENLKCVGNILCCVEGVTTRFIQNCTLSCPFSRRLDTTTRSPVLPMLGIL
jgi:hypothetical protein